jgi:hypothetical protein
MYQVALKALTYQALNPLGAGELGSLGRVYNTKYFMPSARFTIVPGLEVHAQFLIGWASKLDQLVYGIGNTNDDCGFSSDCFYGWEADLAFRAGFNDAWLWTVQLRAAMIF